jgi:hypothetical protein
MELLDGPALIQRIDEQRRAARVPTAPSLDPAMAFG